MRFVKFVLVLLFAFTAAVSFGQTQPGGNNPSPEFNMNESVRIFPNPAIEDLYVRVEHVPANQVKLAVHNILGNEMTVETEVVNEHELKVKVKDLATGYYLLAVKDEQTKFRGTFKFLKR